MRQTCGYVDSVFTELSPSSTRPAHALRSSRPRPGTLSLELQSGLKFGLAVAIGAIAVWGAMPMAAAALLMFTAVAIAYRALLVIGHDPAAPRSIRPRDHAVWDGALAAILAVVTVGIAFTGSTAAAIAAGAATLTLALLRLRTRYVN